MKNYCVLWAAGLSLLLTIPIPSSAQETEEVVVIGVPYGNENSHDPDLVDMNYANSPGSMSAGQLSMGYSGKAAYEYEKSKEIQCKKAEAQKDTCISEAKLYYADRINSCPTETAVTVQGGADGKVLNGSTTIQYTPRATCIQNHAAYRDAMIAGCQSKLSVTRSKIGCK